jgi:predicted aspartyl protease
MRLGGLRRRALLLGAGAGLAARATPFGAVSVDVSGGRCLVPVTLDGRAARLVLDTGAERTLLTDAACVRLGLRRDRWVATTLRGAGGLLERRANVDVASARAGPVALFQLLPEDGLTLPVTSTDLAGADGLLGGDVLRHFVVELDAQRGLLGLHALETEAPAARALPLRSLRGDLLLAPVWLDGHALVALLDTGAATSLINMRGLYRLGVSPAQAQHDPRVVIHGLGGAAPAQLHQFGLLRIGQMEVAKPLMLTELVPEPAYDMVLGLDVLEMRRFRLSYPHLSLSFT